MASCWGAGIEIRYVVAGYPRLQFHATSKRLYTLGGNSAGGICQWRLLNPVRVVALKVVPPLIVRHQEVDAVSVAFGAAAESIPPDADASRNSTGPEGSGCGSMGYSRRRSTTSGGFGRLTHSSRMNGATATFRIEDSDEKRKPR